jgi:hypothetical protein
MIAGSLIPVFGTDNVMPGDLIISLMIAATLPAAIMMLSKYFFSKIKP